MNDDELILNCYRLADRYHVDPEHYLDMPMSRVAMHVFFTVKLIESQKRARGNDDD